MSVDHVEALAPKTSTIYPLVFQMMNFMLLVCWHIGIFLFSLSDVWGLSIEVAANFLVEFFTICVKDFLIPIECVIIAELKDSLKFLWRVISNTKSSWIGSPKEFRNDSIS